MQNPCLNIICVMKLLPARLMKNPGDVHACMFLPSLTKLSQGCQNNQGTSAGPCYRGTGAAMWYEVPQAWRLSSSNSAGKFYTGNLYKGKIMFLPFCSQ